MFSNLDQQYEQARVVTHTQVSFINISYILVIHLLNLFIILSGEKGNRCYATALPGFALADTPYLARLFF